MDTLSADSNSRRVDLHEVGPVWLSGLDGIDAEAAFEGGANLVGVEVGASADLVNGDEPLRLPVAKGAETWAGIFAGEDDLDTVFCADELRMFW